MPAIDVVSDASVALKWFHAEGEEEVPQARALVAAHQARTVALLVLDLTAYEVGNALMRGRAKATADQVATVLEALAEICPAVRPDTDELRLAAELAERHDLTIYDAAYAAVAEGREATLATVDRALLKAGLGSRPSELSQQLAPPATGGRKRRRPR
ncbi:MAG: type II toxin-antitoxin system VapC family toxin [Thermoleophilaceae bacterium]